MKAYTNMTKDELFAEKEALLKRYNDYKAMGLSLDMSRGKPSREQLDISMDLLKDTDYFEDGIDLRNYGILDGIPSCKKLFADLLEVEPKNILLGPNASLSIMFDYIAQCYSHGACGGKPWSKYDEVKFICPVPGYDRHFTYFEYFNM